MSGVPRGSVLGPLFFLICINDLDDTITSNVLKFEDDTNVFRTFNTDGNKQHLQNDVNYKMGDTVVGTTVKECDLGVTVNADMKVSE